MATKGKAKAAKGGGTGYGIPAPQVLAMQVYTKMAQEQSQAATTPEATAAAMKDCLIAAIECACRGQRAADALLVETIADQRLGLGDKDFGAYLCGVLRGTINPTQDLGAAAGLVTAAL